MTVPRIGVTPGDPGGIGPEIVVKTLSRPSVLPPAAYVLFADSRIVAAEEKRLGLRLAAREWRPEGPREAGVYISHVPASGWAATHGRVSAENGEASFRFFETAVAEARNGRLEAVVTAPISKAAWSLGGRPWRGHTDYLAQFYPGAIMSFWSERLKVALFSHHRPLREAVDAVRKDALVDFLMGLHRALEKIPGGPFTLLVAGLNPHAGEDGSLGLEENEEIGPAIDAARRGGVPVTGPFPPDTVFLRALGKKETVVVALTHDQGLIAFKLEAFATGVNVTLGLPFVRTSPDHGTAFDIAGKGIADSQSMEEALRLAAVFTASGS
ncbi:MAG: 4-hydroxythreonine-4-phosphate dehydrogenase PdxA [Candidatus Aminicenantes bacterium]|nr:4-hydroxythreonine-4-phosphate dehydrogenase PdxA [Candidatus Aminicenantes bacterium]MCJ7486127.1 4-hydroxythreonine-4-phosphate dehydrogenase PdxA [Candidatus Aminicenantes bacterium]